MKALTTVKLRSDQQVNCVSASVFLNSKFDECRGRKRKGSTSLVSKLQANEEHFSCSALERANLKARNFSPCILEIFSILHHGIQPEHARVTAKRSGHLVWAWSLLTAPALFLHKACLYLHLEELALDDRSHPMLSHACHFMYPHAGAVCDK